MHTRLAPLNLTKQLTSKQTYIGLEGHRLGQKRAQEGRLAGYVCIPLTCPCIVYGGKFFKAINTTSWNVKQIAK